MQVREAINNSKELNQTLSVLIAAAEGVDAKKLEAMLKQQEALQAALADLKKQVQEADKRLVEQLATNSVAFNADRTQKQKAIEDLDALLSERRKELKAAEDAHREKIANETATQLESRRVELGRLDNAIKVKTKQLEELTKLTEQHKRAVGAL